MAEHDVNIQEARVTYSTKELLKDIHTRLDRIDTAVNNIPTRAEMSQVDQRIGSLETWRAQQEAVRADRSLQFGTRERIVGATVAVALLGLNLLTTFHVI